MTRLGFLSAIALFVVNSSAVAVTTEDASADAAQIIEHSGVVGLSYQARNVVQKALNESQEAITKHHEVAEVIAPAWNPAILEKRWLAYLQQNEEQRAELLDIFSHPALAQARHKEQSAITEQLGSDYQAYMQRLRTNPPAAQRAAYIQQLDQSMRFSVLLGKTREGVYVELERLLPNWQPPADWQNQLKQNTYEFLFYAHRSTPNAELQTLIDLYSSSSMQNWLDYVEQQLPQAKRSVAAVK